MGAQEREKAREHWRIPGWITSGADANGLKHTTRAQLLDNTLRVVAKGLFGVVWLDATDVVRLGAVERVHQRARGERGVEQDETGDIKRDGPPYRSRRHLREALLKLGPDRFFHVFLFRASAAFSFLKQLTNQLHATASQQDQMLLKDGVLGSKKVARAWSTAGLRRTRPPQSVTHLVLFHKPSNLVRNIVRVVLDNKGRP
jgi:hypothetical protein